MKTKTIEIYEFDELSESAQDKAIDNIRTINNEYYEWWDSIYEDAETIGLCLTGFGLDRHRHATGNFKDSAECCAHLIIDNHGETCATTVSAKVYLLDRNRFIENARQWMPDEELEGEYNLTSLLNDLDTDFLQSILEDYSMSLQREYEYKDSKENILGVIACNEYTFNVNGKIENV
jgi:hypothetical protein